MTSWNNDTATNVPMILYLMTDVNREGSNMRYLVMVFGVVFVASCGDDTMGPCTATPPDTIPIRSTTDSSLVPDIVVTVEFITCR
jgi:hypothetical protein